LESPTPGYSEVPARLSGGRFADLKRGSETLSARQTGAPPNAQTFFFKP